MAQGEYKMKIINKNPLYGKYFVLTLWLLFCVGITFPGYSSDPLSVSDLNGLKTCGSAVISPDGKWIAYTVSFQRGPEEEAGRNYENLYLASTVTGEIRGFITGKTNVSSSIWSPDGKEIAFLSSRGDKAKIQVWIIPLLGGEACPATNSPTDILSFRWSPCGKTIAYIATEPPSKRDEKLKKYGYDFLFFEENWKHKNLYIVERKPDGGFSEPKKITDGITLWRFEFSPQGKYIAASVSEKNLVDYEYMFSKIYIIEIATGNTRRLTDNPGKLGGFAFSPDGKNITYTAAKTLNDHSASQLYVIPFEGGEAKNLTPDNFRGHIRWSGFKDDETVFHLASEGVYETFNLVSLNNENRRTILNSRDIGSTLEEPSYTKDFKNFAFPSGSPEHPREILFWRYGKTPKKMTDSNPWLRDKKLGKQEVIRYKARDGWDIEGLLIKPVDYEKGKTYPLLVIVHGGPESNYSDDWVTRYSEAGQVYSGRGYLTFYPNYRASTGYGYDFAMAGLEDPAGKEFDDIADGIDHLANAGLADPERVGLGGGSYGGYAAAWFATYYTKYVKAVVMFVGISDLISKEGTTDIPYEDMYVHMGKKLEDSWDLMLKRSPIYYAHQSRSAALILGGTADARVHPSQSIEFYRRLKMNGHPAVRLVQYPGEGHGNRNQTSRIDLLERHLQWFDWYVKDKKPLDGPMPPLDISDSYGLKLE